MRKKVCVQCLKDWDLQHACSFLHSAATVIWEPDPPPATAKRQAYLRQDGTLMFLGNDPVNSAVNVYGLTRIPWLDEK